MMTQTMKTNQEHFCGRSTNSPKESGNALIYVLIAIVLFAALSMTLARQTDTSEVGTLDEERAELYATQLISYAAQAKSAVDQMLFSGSRIDDLDFTLPTDVNFDTGTVIHKVYHPQGGGLTPGKLPPAMEETTGIVVAGWYMGRFNNVEWTDTAAQEVILSAIKISQPVCEKINQKITGSTAIPALTGGAARDYFVDDSFHAGANADLTTDPAGAPLCAECHNMTSLCVSNVSGQALTFYTIIADQ